MSEPPNKFAAHVHVDDAMSKPVELLHQRTGLSRQQIKSIMKNGAVWLTRGRQTQRLRRATRSVRTGDELHLYFDRAIQQEEPAEPKLIADVDGYSVWNKPQGMRSQGSKWGDHSALPRWVEQHLRPERPAFTVHRLDRAAAGLMLVAHSKGMAAKLSMLFRERKIAKQYLVRVQGDFSTLPNPVRCAQALDNKPAVSEFRFAGANAANTESYLDVHIETGRKHQIRRHLALLGFPVVGDRLYGGAAKDAPDLQLTACRLAFRCPVAGTNVEYTLDLSA